MNLKRRRASALQWRHSSGVPLVPIDVGECWDSAGIRREQCWDSAGIRRGDLVTPDRLDVERVRARPAAMSQCSSAFASRSRSRSTPRGRRPCASDRACRWWRPCGSERQVSFFGGGDEIVPRSPQKSQNSFLTGPKGGTSGVNLVFHRIHGRGMVFTSMPCLGFNPIGRVRAGLCPNASYFFC